MTQGNVNLKLGLDTSPATAALQQYYRQLNQGAQSAASSQRPVSTALEKVVQSAKKLGLTYDKVNRSFKDSKGAVQTLSQVKQRVDQLNASLAKTQQTATTALNGIGAGFKQVLSGIPQGIGLAIGQQLLAPLTNFGSVINGAVGGAVKRFVDIDAALRQTASISGATEEEFKQLQSAVIGLAKDTKFTTGELAEASIALARAGFTAKEVQEALPGIAEGAAAAGQSMDQMADTVIGAMGGFQKGTEETIDVVDVLTATANGSNQSVTDLGEALKYVGPIANGLGLTLEDTSAALGLLANAGIRGSQAGTTLRAGLSRLSAAAAGNNSEFASLSRGTGRLSETLRLLGADITNSAGDLKAFPELLKTLKSSLGDLSANEQQLVSKILFGEEAAAGFRALLASSVEDIDNFAAATNNATGVAKETSEKNLAGIAGSLTFLSSAFDAASATVGQFLGTIIKPLIDGLTAVINVFNALPAPIQATLVGVVALGGALAVATAAFVLFKAVAGAGLFAGMATAITGATTAIGTYAASAAIATGATTKLGVAMAVVKGVATSVGGALMGLGGILKGALIKGYALTTAAAGALNTILLKQISIKAIAAGAWGKLGVAMKAVMALNMKGIIAGIGTTLTGLVGKTGLLAGGFAKAGLAAKAFLVSALPIAGLAVAIGAVVAVWDTYSKVTKQASEVTASAKPIQEELTKALKEQGVAADETGEKVSKLDKEWETSVERVGGFQASLDILRRGLGLTTAETAQLQQGTFALYKEFGEILGGADKLVEKYREVAEELKDASPEERAEKMKQLAAIEKSVKEAVSGSVQELKKQRDAFVATAGGVDELTEAEQQQLTAFDTIIASFSASGEHLGALKGKYVEAKDAANAFNEVADGTPSGDNLQALEAKVKDTSAAFKGEMKAMEEAFKNFKTQLAAGVKTEVDAIKADIASIKSDAKIFSDSKDEEIRAIREVGTEQQRTYEDAKKASSRSAASAIADLKRQGDAAKSASDERVRALQREGAATSAMYDATISSANATHDRVMSNLDAQLRAINRQKQAVNDRYDAELSRLRELTPAEKQLAALDRYRLEQQAKLGGEEGLRARAQLERADADARATEVQKQKAEELKRLEEEANAKAEEKRKKEEEHEEKMKKLAEEKAQAEKTNAEEIQKVKDEAAEKEKENTAAIAEIQEQATATQQQLEDQIQQQKRENADEIKRLEDEKRQDKEASAAKEEELLKKIEAVEEAANQKKTQAEEEYANKRDDMLERFNTAIGNTSDVIVREGNSAWGTYASNAIAELARVEAAAKRAAAAAAANGNGGSDTRWTGGPVSAGQSYTVNELGQEAFMSSTGKLSMIDAPAFGRWKAPSKGTVINAAQTEKLGLPSAGSSLGKGAAIDPTGGVTAQRVGGNESRDLLRAIAKATGGDTIHNNVTIQAANTTQAASDMMVELTKVKRRRLR